MTKQTPYSGAKLPAADRGITVRRSICGICNAGCSVDASVKDGRVVKVSGCKQSAFGNGYLCARGHANRQYIYHPDRLTTPLRRTGARGTSSFEPISWDSALDEIGQRLNAARSHFGADSVVFTAGGSLWSRTYCHRLANSFGSANYGTDFCMEGCAATLAGGISAGVTSHADLSHAGVVLMWGCNLYNQGNTIVSPVLTEKSGAKVIAIDPRVTVSTCRLADLFLQIRPGTDAALAHGLAHIFLEKGWVDRDYIEHHIQGFFDYRAYVGDFTPQRVFQLTGISPAQLENAAHIIMCNGPMTVLLPDDAFAQQSNGVQTIRAIEALCAITGNYDARGGLLPNLTPSPEGAVLADFAEECRVNSEHDSVGAHTYPLWGQFIHQCQMTDLPRQGREDSPYPLRAMCSFGLNMTKFADNHAFSEFLKNLDFFVDADLFMTPAARFADIVLPVCSSFERESVQITLDHRLFLVDAAVLPMGQSRPDEDIVCELAKRLTPNDTLLCAGTAAVRDTLLMRMGVSTELLRRTETPVQLEVPSYRPGEYTRSGYRTPSGKYELKSARMAAAGYASLPEYAPPRSDFDARDYPFLLSVGNRQTFGFHSRTHRIDWIRALQPAPAVDMHPDDAKLLCIQDGDSVSIRTAYGSVEMVAHLTRTVQRGMVCVLPDYEEADICAILPGDEIDPVSGVPALRTMSCALCRADSAKKEVF